MSFSYVNGELKDVGGFKGEVKTRLTGLTDPQRVSILSALFLQKTKMDAATQVVYDWVQEKGLVVLAINCLQLELRVKFTSANVARRYSTSVRSETIGTVTEVEGDEDEKCVWGTRMPQGKFSGNAVVAEMVSSCFSKKDGKMVLKPFSKSKELRKLTPVSNPFSGFSRLGEESANRQVLRDKCYDLLEKHQGLDGQWAQGLVSMAPPAVKTKNGVGSIVRGTKTMFKKASPTIGVVPAKVTFSQMVGQIAKMTPAIGSKKEGMGRLSAAHYDGNVELEPGMRKKQTYVDDYIPVVADVYFVDSSDAAFVNALYRKVCKYNSDQCVLVYRSKVISPEFRKCISTENGKSVVVSSGVVGCNPALWQTVTDLTTCVLYFNTITKKGSTSAALMDSAREEVEVYRRLVSRYDHHQFYGFVGGMSDDDKCIVSTGGSDGRVIYVDHNRGRHGRKEMVDIVFQMVRHALLFPWMQSCYMLKRNGEFVYPGAREIFGEYDFTSLEKKEGFFTSVSDTELVKNILDDEYAKFFIEQDKEKEKVLEESSKTEEVDEDDTGLFDAEGVDV